MQRDGQLDHTEVRAKVPPRHRHLLDEERSDRIREHCQLIARQSLQVTRTPDLAKDIQLIRWAGQRRSLNAEVIGRDRCACLTHHRPFRDVLAKRRPPDPVFRSVTEIVVAVWREERSSAPLQSRPNSTRYYLSPI